MKGHDMNEQERRESLRLEYHAARRWERLVRDTRCSSESDIRKAIASTDEARERYRAVGGFD